MPRRLRIKLHRAPKALGRVVLRARRKVPRKRKVEIWGGVGDESENQACEHAD